jgi:hypothetical protein
LTEAFLSVHESAVQKKLEIWREVMKQLFLILFICVFALASCKSKESQQGNERILSKKEVIQGTTFSEGTSVKTDKKGLLSNVILGADQPVMDINCKAVFPYVFKKGTHLKYMESIIYEKPEVPSAINIKEKHNIMGIDFPAESKLEPAAAMGTIGDKKTCSVMYIQVQLGEPMVLKGRQFPAYEYIHVYSNNKIVYRENGVEKTLK